MSNFVFNLIRNIGDPEMVFWCLYDIMFNKNWRLICKNNTPKFIE